MFSIASIQINLKLSFFYFIYSCSYDYLEIIEQLNTNFIPHRTASTILDSTSSQRNFRHNRVISNNGNFFGSLQNRYNLHSNINLPSPDNIVNPQQQQQQFNDNKVPQKVCGDWSSKLKLLRYVTMGPLLGLHFISDYSHHFGGYKAKVFMENGEF